MCTPFFSSFYGEFYFILIWEHMVYVFYHLLIVLLVDLLICLPLDSRNYGFHMFFALLQSRTLIRTFRSAHKDRQLVMLFGLAVQILSGSTRLQL